MDRKTTILFYSFIYIINDDSFCFYTIHQRGLIMLNTIHREMSREEKDHSSLSYCKDFLRFSFSQFLYRLERASKN